VVVLVSGGGSILQALIDASADPGYGVRIVAVGSDRDDAGGLDRAQRAGIPVFVCRPADHADRDAWDQALATELGRHLPGTGLEGRPWAVSAGFMRLLGPAVLSRCTVLNSHPALLPSFPGTRAVADALQHGVTVTGVTVHLVDAGMDTGPIVAQRAVPVRPSDDEETLHERIKVVERDLVVRTVRRVLTRGAQTNNREVLLP
jgi:phosphoribosylglycinamide formyltransferase-1